MGTLLFWVKGFNSLLSESLGFLARCLQLGERVSPKCRASLCTHYSCCPCLGFSVGVSSHKCCGHGKHVGSVEIICATCHACSPHFCVPSGWSSGAQRCWGGITHPYGVIPGSQLASVNERVLPFIYGGTVGGFKFGNEIGREFSPVLVLCSKQLHWNLLFL